MYINTLVNIQIYLNTIALGGHRLGYMLGKGGRIRFKVRIAINSMHRIRGFESINRIGFNVEK